MENNLKIEPKIPADLHCLLFEQHRSGKPSLTGQGDKQETKDSHYPLGCEKKYEKEHYQKSFSMISQRSAFFKAGKQKPLGTDSCKCLLVLRLLADSSALPFCQRYPRAWCSVGQVQCPCSPAFALQYQTRHERGSSSFLPSFDTFANVARA